MGAMASIYDVARASGVSAATVSHVLNHSRYVSPQTTQRVLEAAEALGYQPRKRRGDVEDRTLSPRQGIMGFIIDRGLLTVCGCRAYVRMARHYDWITISVDGVLTERQLLRYIKEYHLSRVLIHQSVEYRYGEQLFPAEGAESVILLNQQPCTPERAGFRHFTLDYETAVTMALEHLIRCGHTNITLVGGSLNSFCRRQILQALHRCAELHDLRLGEDNILWLGKAGRESILPQELGTAVISLGGPGSIAVRRCCLAAGKHIPQDFSWVSVDDDDFTQVYSEDITHVRLDPAVFRAGIEDPPGSDSPVICRPEFLIRHSTGMLPKDPYGQLACRENAVNLSITEKMLLQKKGCRVGVSFAQADTLYSQMILQGIREVAANLNFELLPVQDARLTQTLEESQLVWLLQNGAEAVISVSNDHTGMAGPFDRISRSSRVPLILGSHLPAILSPTAYYSCVTTNDEEKGRQAAQFLAEQMLPRGLQRLILITDKRTNMDSQRCMQALLAVLSGDYPLIRVLEQVTVQSSYGLQAFRQLYEQYPDMQGLYVQDAGVAAEISRFLCACGREDIVIVTSQLNSTIANQILQSASGWVGLVSSRPLELGHLMAYAAGCAILGKKIPKYVAVDPITLNRQNVEELWPILTQSRLK